MPKTNVYLLIGENEVSKLTKLNKLKEEFLFGESIDFNFESLTAKKLKKKTLQEAILRLPVKSQKRALIIRNIEDLPKDCKEEIISYVKKPFPYLMLILEAESSDREIDKIAACSQVMHFRKVKPYDVFALGGAIRNRNQESALYILADLLLRGEKPQKIMGGLIWQWERMQSSITKAKIDKGFKFLLEADLSIKSSSLKIATALELLVVKLTLLV